jgi:hypothetical protein
VGSESIGCQCSNQSDTVKRSHAERLELEARREMPMPIPWAMYRSWGSPDRCLWMQCSQNHKTLFVTPTQIEIDDRTGVCMEHHRVRSHKELPGAARDRKESVSLTRMPEICGGEVRLCPASEATIDVHCDFRSARRH